MAAMYMRPGFTLIELSIVLVIIGLIVGAVLVGQDLIHSAEIRATIAQIEKYQTAVNTFRGKYGYLPGDIRDPDATRFGFLARGQYAGEGNGNGVVESIDADAPNQIDPDALGSGESGMFWVDLSTAGLIDGSFNTARPTMTVNVAASSVPLYLPAAKLGRGSFIYTRYGGWSAGDGFNYFGLGGVNSMMVGGSNVLPTLSVLDAYNMDKKVDDGLPQSGGVMAWYVYYGAGGWAGNFTAGGPFTTATAASATTCFDNGNTNGSIQQYSVGYKSGTGMNCALTFRFQ
jgi:prepilin-type N-terminal cleavage/methylation domain-containing protein